MECKNPSLPLQHLQEDSPPSKSQKQQVKCNILEVNLPDIGMNPRRRRFWDQQQKCFQSRVWKLKKGLRKTIVPSKRAFEEGLKLEACNSSFASKQSVIFYTNHIMKYYIIWLWLFFIFNKLDSPGMYRISFRIL